MRVAVPNVRCMTAIDRLQELTRPTGEEDLMAVRYPKPRLSVPVKPAAAVVVALLVAVGAWAATRGGGDAAFVAGAVNSSAVPERDLSVQLSGWMVQEAAAAVDLGLSEQNVQD